MRRYFLPLVGLGLIMVSLSGCVVYPARGPGWCYYHPYKC